MLMLSQWHCSSGGVSNGQQQERQGHTWAKCDNQRGWTHRERQSHMKPLEEPTNRMGEWFCHLKGLEGGSIKVAFSVLWWIWIRGQTRHLVSYQQRCYNSCLHQSMQRQAWTGWQGAAVGWAWRCGWSHGQSWWQGGTRHCWSWRSRCGPCVCPWQKWKRFSVVRMLTRREIGDLCAQQWASMWRRGCWGRQGTWDAVALSCPHWDAAAALSALALLCRGVHIHIS